MTNESTNANDNELAIGWKWFEFHASQRITTFKFFLTLYAASGAVALALLDKGYAGFGLLAGIIAFCIPLLFWSMDKRSRQLTEIGEAIIDAQWKHKQFAADLNPIERANNDPARGKRYKAVFGRLFFLGLLGALAIIAWAAVLIDQKYGTNASLFELYERVVQFLRPR